MALKRQELSSGTIRWINDAPSARGTLVGVSVEGNVDAVTVPGGAAACLSAPAPAPAAAEDGASGDEPSGGLFAGTTRLGCVPVAVAVIAVVVVVDAAEAGPVPG